MDKRCVVGIFSNDKQLRPIVNKLLEMRFEERDISVIRSGGFDYATNLGPLKGATLENLSKKLIHVGLAADLSRSFKSSLKDGGALVAVACEDHNIDEVGDLLGSYGAIDVQLSE